MDDDAEKISSIRRGSTGNLDGFLKSRKTEHSPVRKRKEREESIDMDKMTELFEKMTKKLKEHNVRENEKLKYIMEENNREIQQMVEGIRAEIAEMKDKQKNWEEERHLLSQEIKQREQENAIEKEKVKILQESVMKIERKLELEEKERRKLNIIIKGKSFNKENLRNDVNEFIKEKINPDVTITEAKLIESKSNSFVAAKVENMNGKTIIMKEKWKLKREEERIYIDNDLTPLERNVQKKLREIGKQARENNKNVKIGYQKIKINDKWFKWDFQEMDIKEQKNSTKN